tara:strand:- start:117 stop:998 length:882 start_codon:yes stop_codon:yes gene_type:complete
MRILFIGAVKFSEKMLLKLISIQAEIVGVITLQKSAFNTDHHDLTSICKEAGIPVKYSENINSSGDLNWIKSKKPHVIYCFGWSRLLKTSILNVAPLGVIGYHPAALPKNRGRHPLIWALVLGLEETASTFFFMDEGADSGDIISQYPVKIESYDDAGTLYKKITKVAQKQVVEITESLKKGSFIRTPQNHKKATYWRKRSKIDGKIDWRMSSKSIHNLVRALAKPYAGAHFDFENKIIKVWAADVIKSIEGNIEPGKVISSDLSGTIVKTGDHYIKLKKLEPKIKLNRDIYL